jgi:hypothetical protein
MSDTAAEPIDAMSISEFCRRHSISTDYFFKLQRAQRGPRVMSVGKRTLISVDAAAKWRREQERETAKAAQS